jgi:hypothetical protein
MKNLILIVSLFCITSVLSQEEVTRTIDWQNLNEINKTKLLEPVKNQKFAVFKIDDINKFLYKVEISGKGFNLDTPVPTELQTLFRLSADEKTALTNNDKATKATEDIKNENNAMKKIADEIAVKESKKSSEVTKEELQLKAKIIDLNIVCGKYYIKAAELTGLLFELKVLKVDLINIAQMDASMKIIKEKEAVNKTVPSIEKIYRDFLKLYAEVEIYYENAKAAATNEDYLKKIDEATDKIEKSFEVFKEENILTLHNEITFLHGELNNESNYIVQAPPIQMTGDFVEYKCKITPTKTNTLGAYKSPIELNFIIPNNGGVKVDFSVGPTLSFGKGAKDELFYLEESTTIGKSYLRQRDNNNVALPGLAAMMHVYDRGVKETKIGGLFGVGAGFQSIEDVDLSFYLGASVILGKMQKVMINTGFSFLRVDRLKEKEYEVGKEYTTQDFNLDNVVEKVFQTSFFIGLSYSLAKRVEN